MKKFFYLAVGSLGASAITVALVLLLVPFQTPTVLDGLHFSAPSMHAAAVEEDEILGAPFVRYKSETFAYSLRYPGTWDLDDKRSTTTSDVLYGPNKDVIVRINTAPLEEITDIATLEAKANAMHDLLMADKDFSLSGFKRITLQKYPAVRAEGTRQTETSTWRITAITIFRLDKRDTLSLLFTTSEQKFPEYEEAIEEIVNSLDIR